jgi:FAD/FMN-containing dehydrogenase
MTYSQKKQKLTTDFLSLRQKSGSSIGLYKSTSNLFRDRSKAHVKRLDVRSFNSVIKIDEVNLSVEAEGMITFEDLVQATLKQGLLPLIVPELKTITLGGGIAGLAIESSSFKYGLVHESIQEIDVLLASGRVVTCRPDNKYSDLFYAMPNSYGTLGYILRVKAKLRKASQYVRLRHLKFDNAEHFFKNLEAIATNKMYENQPVDFIEGTFFSPSEMYISLGFDSDEAAYVSDYTSKHIYYKSIAQRSEDYLTTHDYIWRWDTDWFWCSKNLLMENVFIRRVLGKKYLGSRTYSKLMRLSQTSKLFKIISKLGSSRISRESVIQDVEIPMDKADEFLSWFNETIGIKPIWICPTKAATKSWPYPLYPMDPAKLYINFGFWDAVATKNDADKAYFNKLIEQKVEALGGIKSLYSDSFYKKEHFARIYNYQAYKKLKKRYDPDAYFKDLYAKAVR